MSEVSINDLGRNAAAANIFSVMASPEKSKDTIENIRSMTDQQIDVVGKLFNVPLKQLSMFRSIVRGEKNQFFEEGTFKYEVQRSSNQGG